MVTSDQKQPELFLGFEFKSDSARARFDYNKATLIAAAVMGDREIGDRATLNLTPARDPDQTEPFPFFEVVVHRDGLGCLDRLARRAQLLDKIAFWLHFNMYDIHPTQVFSIEMDDAEAEIRSDLTYEFLAKLKELDESHGQLTERH